MGNFKEKLIRDTFKHSGIDATPFVESGIIHINDLKKWVVKKEYYKRAKNGQRYSAIKLDLSEEYGISVSSIEKLIYRHHEKRSA